MQLLDSSINILDSGVSDFPRLATVLQTTRVSYVALASIHITPIVVLRCFIRFLNGI